MYQTSQYPTQSALLDKQEPVFIVDIVSNVRQSFLYLCSKYPTREWSGTIFFRQIEESPLRLEVIDFYLNDIGSSGFTEYEYDSEIVAYGFSKGYFGENSGVYMGHVHSHNNMGVFYSGTDIQELKDSANRQTCAFLSIVTNNKSEFVAAISSKEIIKGLKTITVSRCNLEGVFTLVSEQQIPIDQTSVYIEYGQVEGCAVSHILVERETQLNAKPKKTAYGTSVIPFREDQEGGGSIWSSSNQPIVQIPTQTAEKEGIISTETKKEAISEVDDSTKMILVNLISLTTFETDKDVLKAFATVKLLCPNAHEYRELLASHCETIGNFYELTPVLIGDLLEDLDLLTKNKIEVGNEHYNFFVNALEVYSDILASKEYEAIISEPALLPIFTLENES